MLCFNMGSCPGWKRRVTQKRAKDWLTERETVAEKETDGDIGGNKILLGKTIGKQFRRIRKEITCPFAIWLGPCAKIYFCLLCGLGFFSLEAEVM